MEATINNRALPGHYPTPLLPKWQLRLPRRAAQPVAARKLRAFKMPVSKRLFDIVFAGAVLLVLLPLLAVVAALIWLESPGPIFYYSYRVGTNYRIFRFWKFRSMRPNADQQLATLKNTHNQYQAAPAEHTANNCACGGECQGQLIDKQGRLVCERQHRQVRRASEEAAFVKFVNDPRVTRVGTFLRNTSIDELPQLFNVLRGDMSIVGNRPLPLYEAEKLTTDQFATRFLAPAGITGLWQVSKRGGKGPMSADERKGLDVKYARNYSLKSDLLILLKTVPALFQQENV
jgi:lipopolysaccharide/colanic/teichoic acid biosynthesis glycosyltransferase